MSGKINDNNDLQHFQPNHQHLTQSLKCFCFTTFILYQIFPLQ